MTSETCQLAMNLARNCGYAVFPVGEDKRPTRPSEDGVMHGFHDATKDPEQIAWLWEHWPGPLIGIRTGETAGVSVLDIDPDAYEWWQANHHRIPATRAYERHRHGTHLYMQHREGVRNSQGKIVQGVDTRGEGGYTICWFAAGYGCRDHSPPAPWPDWLLEALTPPERAEPAGIHTAPSEASLAAIDRRVAVAIKGERNGVLYWAACRLAERGIAQTNIEALLVPVIATPDFDKAEARQTIKSAVRRAA